MEEENKQKYLSSFPAISYEAQAKINDTKGYGNFCVFIAWGNVLYVRCFHKYSKKSDGIRETQRYVFAPEGCVRYGVGINTGRWQPMREFREPVFMSGFGYYHDNSYSVIGQAEYKKTFLKYCQLNKYNDTYPLLYLKFYIKHRNAEYLMKSGYEHIVKEEISGHKNYGINWKSNNLLKMLGLSRTEFELLKSDTSDYWSYKKWRDEYPNCTPQEILKYLNLFGCAFGQLEHLLRTTGLTVRQAFNYLQKQQDENDHVYLTDWTDYLRCCAELNYDITDSAISRPKNLILAHEKANQTIKCKDSKKAEENFRTLIKEREKLCFELGDYIIRQPESMSEIIAEGAALSHCVGGYAERHANGKLNIMFLRRKIEPDKPFYTVEVSVEGEIVQCRGYKNNWVENGGTKKPQEIEDFEKAYQEYLSSVFTQKKVRMAV